MKSRFRLRRLMQAALVLAVAAGCSSDPQTRKLLAESIPGKARLPEPHPLFMAAYKAGAPGIAAAVESKPEAIAVLLRQAVSDSGGVVTTIAADGSQLMFDRGVLVGSRGFGYDLMASEVSQSVALIRALRPGHATRLMTLIDGDDRAVTRTFRCEITPGEAESVVIGTEPVAARTVTETCRGALASFNNYYWVVPGTGQIIQSSQWVGPLTGKISLRLTSMW